MATLNELMDYITEKDGSEPNTSLYKKLSVHIKGRLLLEAAEREYPPEVVIGMLAGVASTLGGIYKLGVPSDLEEVMNSSDASP